MPPKKSPRIGREATRSIEQPVQKVLRELPDLIASLEENRKLLSEIADMQGHEFDDDHRRLHEALQRFTQLSGIDMTSLLPPVKPKGPLAFTIETHSVEALGTLIQEARAIKKALLQL